MEVQKRMSRACGKSVVVQQKVEEIATELGLESYVLPDEIVSTAAAACGLMEALRAESFNDKVDALYLLLVATPTEEAMGIAEEQAQINDAIAQSCLEAKSKAEAAPPTRRCYVCGRHSCYLYRLDDLQCMHGACTMECYLKLQSQWIDLKYELMELDASLSQASSRA